MTSDQKDHHQNLVGIRLGPKGEERDSYRVRGKRVTSGKTVSSTFHRAL